MNALVAGFHIHLPKPIDAAELLRVVSGMANRSRRTPLERGDFGSGPGLGGPSQSGRYPDCPTPLPPLSQGGRWKEVARVSATSACASTPCSQSIMQREAPPVSYFVVAVRGPVASAPSNVMTVDSTSGSAHARR